MSLSTRINNMIEEAYAKGQTTISTTLQGFEMFEQDEIDELITNLRARGIQVSHDDVFNDMSLNLPRLTLAERARRISYNNEEVIRKNITGITESIIELSRHGITSVEEDFLDIADDAIVDPIQAHFIREGFKVVRKNKSLDNYIQLHISWSK